MKKNIGVETISWGRNTESHSCLQDIKFFHPSVTQEVTRIFKVSHVFTHQFHREMDEGRNF